MSEEKQVINILLNSPKKENKIYPTQEQMQFLSSLSRVFQLGKFEYTVQEDKKTEELFLTKNRM